MTEDTTPSAIRIVTVSLRDPRDSSPDDTGSALQDEFAQAGFQIMRHRVLRQDTTFIREFVQEVANQNEGDVVVINGGTGIGRSDRTAEALAAIYDQPIDGFAEAFRRLYYEVIGPKAMFSRVSAGVFNECLIYALPADKTGTLVGARKLIIPTLRDAIKLASGELRGG